MTISATPIEKYGHPELIAGATRVFGAAREWVEKPVSYSSRRLPKRAPARHQSVYVSRQSLVDAGGFDTTDRIAADYELHLRLSASGIREVLIT